MGYQLIRMDLLLIDAIQNILPIILIRFMTRFMIGEMLYLFTIRNTNRGSECKQ